jgi:hypothetical protein
MTPDTIERLGYVPSDSELRRFDMVGAIMVAIMVLGPMLAGIMR